MSTAPHMVTAHAGETRAVRYLEDKGYRILERNWRYLRCEIDIIAGKDLDVVFVEVKTRGDSEYGVPELSVNRAKQRRMAQAAWAFMENIKPGFTPRFDVVAIVNHGPDMGLLHVEDAFVPNWLY